MLKGYRTTIFNGIVVLFAGLPALLPSIKMNLPDSAYSWILFVVGVGNIILRSVTTTPVGKAE